jgi:hypothetical protein
MNRIAAPFTAATLALLAARPVRAQDDDKAAAPPPATAEDEARRNERLRKVLVDMEREPSIVEVQLQSIRYFRVHPEALEKLRGQTLSRWGLPPVDIGYDQVIEDTEDRFDGRGLWESQGADNVRDQRRHRVGIGLSWNLPGLVFDPSLLQTYALTAIQMNILKEVTRIYYIRQQLLLGLRTDPPEDLKSRASQEMRVAEFTALLDAFTGGWFSQAGAGRLSRIAAGKSSIPRPRATFLSPVR